MKKMNLLVLSLLLLTGCGVTAKTEVIEPKNNNIEEKLYTEKLEDIFEAEDSPSFISLDATDKEIYDTSSHIVIAKVEGIIKSDNYNQIEDRYMFPYTIYKVSIIENLKGNLTLGGSYKVYKPGGVISIEDDYKSLNEQERSKRLSYNDGKIPEGLTHRYIMDDVSLEPNKTYMLCLCEEDTYYQNPDEYYCKGFWIGSREFNSENRCVLNNLTLEWESLEAVISK